MTLAELEEIGREVGLAPEAIARAAARVERGASVAIASREGTRFLGQTIGVGRALEVPRPLTDDEWHRLVVLARETFDAKGKISEQGAFRQWSNGNLRLMVEPAGEGQQIRLRTSKGNARAFQSMGLAFSGMGSLLMLIGEGGDPAILVAMGLGFFLTSRLSIPFWARTRAKQFEEILERVRSWVETE